MPPPIVVSRRIAAPPDVVYSYLTESERWSRWQGSVASMNPQPGGVFTMTMPNGARARGEFVELVPDEKVVFTWGWVDHPGLPPGSSTVEITIAAQGDESLVTITHHGLPADEIETHRTGWDHYLPRLAAVAEGRDVGPDPGPGADRA